MAIHSKDAIGRVTANHAATIAKLEARIDKAITETFDGRHVRCVVEAEDAILNAVREIYEAAGWSATITRHPSVGDPRDYTPAYTTIDLTPKR